MFDDGVLELEKESSECRLERFRLDEDKVVRADHHGSDIFFEGTHGCVEVVSCTFLRLS